MKRKRTITLKLTKHHTGMWCKRIDGKLRYFGVRYCPESEARAELMAFLQAREMGVAYVRRGMTLNELASRYAAACERRVELGQLQADSWADYNATIQEFVGIVGESCDVEGIGPTHFSEVVAVWRKRLGSVRFGNNVQAIRTMFNWAGPDGLRLISRLPNYGTFRKLDKSKIRAERRIKEREDGLRKFSNDEIRAMLKAATGRMRAWILLALNGGMYSVDIADLRGEDIRVEGDLYLIDTLRHKTSAIRCTPLWPETVEALRPYICKTGLIFTTAQGNSFNQRENNTDSIGLMFRKWVKSISVYRKNCGFGTFRHTHVSAVNDHRDASARVIVRGHTIKGVDEHYDIPETDRLKSVTDLARLRLLIHTGVVRAAKANVRRGQSDKSHHRTASASA